MPEKLSTSLQTIFGRSAYHISTSSPHKETALGKTTDKCIATYPPPINQFADYREELSLKENHALIASINDYLSLDPLLRKMFLNTLFRDRDSILLYTSYNFLVDMFNKRRGKYESSAVLEELLSHPLLPQLIPTVGYEDTPRTRSLTALLLTKAPASAIPEQVKETLEVNESASDVKIIPANGFTNCFNTEPRMLSSLTRGDITLVNGHLLVKGFGYKTALCLATTATRQGTFYEGSWYSPLDRKTKKKVKRALNQQDRQIVMDTGEWVFVRDTSIYLDPEKRIDLLNQAKTAVGMQ